MKNLKNDVTPTLFRKHLTYHRFGNLEYVTLTHIPVVRFEEHVPDFNKVVAGSLLRKNIPIYGRELHFLRKDALKLTLTEFAPLLSVTYNTVHLWEKRRDQRLHPINELAVRSLVAERLKISVKLRLLDPTLSQTPNKTEIKINVRKIWHKE